MNVLRITQQSRTRKQQIQSFISEQFKYEFPDLQEALLRVIIEDDQKIIGHCALMDKEINHNEDRFNMLFLGCMCIEGKQRHSGLGRVLLEEVKAFLEESDYGGIILNCGERVSGFYRKCGFTQVSSKASYQRGERIEIDDDPVFVYMKKGKAFSPVDIVFLGEDF